MFPSLPPEAPPQALPLGGLSGLTIAGGLYVATTYDAPWAAPVGIVAGVAVAAFGVWLMASADKISDTQVSL
jgi:hypothetical protein